MKEQEPMDTIIFQDKKESRVDYARITKHIQEAHALSKEMDVGQEEATVVVHPEYPNLPINFIWVTDVHYGNMSTQYDLLNRHLEIAEHTPNTYVIFGGDLIDGFSAAKHPVASLGDAISPQVQAQAMMTRVLELDQKNKVLGLAYGNHEGFVEMAGLDFYQSFAGDMTAPIFNKNGVLNLVVGRETYRMGLWHKFWGLSKINVSNRGKRAIEYGGYSNIEIALLGDDHQASAEIFSKNGKRMLVIDGGTYKYDSTGPKWGLGHAGVPGYTTFLWPQEHKFEVVHDPETAQDMMDALVYLEKLKS